MANKKKKEHPFPRAIWLWPTRWLEQTMFGNFQYGSAQNKRPYTLPIFTHGRTINMSKILVQSAILLTLFGPLSSWAGEPVSPKIEDAILSAPKALELASQCRAEARQKHNLGVFPRKQSRNSAVLRRHSIALVEFCDAFEGKPSNEFWNVISPSNDPSDRPRDFLSACLSEENGGRRTVFKPSRRHIERMASICREMSEKLPSK